MAFKKKEKKEEVKKDYDPSVSILRDDKAKESIAPKRAKVVAE